MIGNPPFIRYQDFSGEARARSRAAALRAGVGLTNLASSWAAFAVHAALFLRPGGRIGLVLPAELLSVNYAAQVRRFPLESFASVELVLFSERVFPGVQEEVVLLLAEGYRHGPTDHASVYQVRNAAGLSTSAAGREVAAGAAGGQVDALAAAGRRPVRLRRADLGRRVHRPGDVGGHHAGDGHRQQQVLRPVPAAGRRAGAAVDGSAAVVPAGSRHLRALSLTAAALDEFGDQGAATWLFRPDGEPSPAARAYIAAGETTGVHTAYKCRVRTPWWRVPLVPAADLLLTYMNADTPRLCTNATRAGHLNSVHGVYLRPDYAPSGRSCCRWRR